MADKMKIKKNRYYKILNLICMLLLAGIWAYLLISWNELPDKIPGHYNGAGEIDRWGNKWELLLTPIISVLLYIGISALEKYPGNWNTGVTITEKNKDKVYQELMNMVVTLKAVVVLNFSYITFTSIRVMKLGRWYLLFVIGATFIPIVIFIYRSYRVPK